MADVTFYLLESSDDEQHQLLSLACQLCANCFDHKRKVTVFCQDQAQAEQIDELLWQLPAARFVPHNLGGEGPVNGTPVEILWQAPRSLSRPVLINLAEQMPEFARRCQHIYDFVPASESRKQIARERYKHYRAAGHQLQTQPAASMNEN